jgi:ribosomal protein S18 acetylase RimI-like enzyme
MLFSNIPMPVLTYTTASSEKDLLGIMALQQQNLAIHLQEPEINSQGFVTALHSLHDLQQMNDIEPHIICKENDKVVAYLLAMTCRSQFDIPVLVPMFELFKHISYSGKAIADYHYMVVGQACVDKAYRGQGILDECYRCYRKTFQEKYDFAITEIATRNQRSIKAHQRIGFKELHRYISPDNEEWSIVFWPW